MCLQVFINITKRGKEYGEKRVYFKKDNQSLQNYFFPKKEEMLFVPFAAFAKAFALAVVAGVFS